MRLVLMRGRNHKTWWGGLSLVALCGCLGPWRPTTEQVVPHEQTEVVVTPAACLEAIRSGRWVYERRSLTPRVEEPAGDYIRVMSDGRMVEVSRELGEFPQAVFTEQEATSQPAVERPAGRSRDRRWNYVGLRIELADPMDPFPPALTDTSPIVTTTGVSYAGPTGPTVARGTLTRTVQIEGYEDVDCPAGRFERCLRIRVDLAVRFPFMVIVDWSTYHWLHPRAGEVRRVQRLAGWFWFWWFGGAHEYLLKSYELMPHEPGTEASPLRWSKMLLVLDRTFPHPRIAGLSVEMAATHPAP